MAFFSEEELQETLGRYNRQNPTPAVEGAEKAILAPATDHYLQPCFATTEN
jgi:hypothetical protein